MPPIKTETPITLRDDEVTVTLTPADGSCVLVIHDVETGFLVARRVYAGENALAHAQAYAERCVAA